MCIENNNERIIHFDNDPDKDNNSFDDKFIKFKVNNRPCYKRIDMIDVGSDIENADGQSQKIAKHKELYDCLSYFCPELKNTDNDFELYKNKFKKHFQVYDINVFSENITTHTKCRYHFGVIHHMSDDDKKLSQISFDPEHNYHIYDFETTKHRPQCVCSHHTPMYYLVLIKNIKNDIYFLVGSKCIEKFIDKDIHFSKCNRCHTRLIFKDEKDKKTNKIINPKNANKQRFETDFSNETIRYNICQNCYRNPLNDIRVYLKPSLQTKEKAREFEKKYKIILHRDTQLKLWYIKNEFSGIKLEVRKSNLLLYYKYIPPKRNKEDDQ